MQDDREGRARHALKVYCLSRWSTEYKTVKDAENELISRLEVDGMPEQVLPLRVRMSACIMPARKESMHVFFNAYKCICARARTAVASERMWREECREARGSGTTLGDPLAGGSGEPLCTEARGECTVEVSPRPVHGPVGPVSHRVGSPGGGTGEVAPRPVGSVTPSCRESEERHRGGGPSAGGLRKPPSCRTVRGSGPLGW